MNSIGGTYIPKHQNSSPVKVNFRLRSPNTRLSARKLAAHLWHLQLQSSPPPRVKRSKEELTTRSPPRCEASSNVLNAKIHSKKLLKERKRLIGDSVLSVLLSELLRAQTCINKLKAQHKSSNKKLEDEKLLWKRRHHHKTQLILEDLKDKLRRERRSRERMESLSTKLAHELTEAKLCAKQFMINYEEEKKKRELIEEVCNELAMQVGEDRAKLEGLQRHSMKTRQEMEEERKMFQMAEMWREESIQMKLVDVKLALEDKYNQMIHLISHLQNFLSSRGVELDTTELRDGQLIKQEAESVSIHCITSSCDFAMSNDVFSNLFGPSSNVHIVSIDEDCLNNNSVLHKSSSSSDYNTGLEVIKAEGYENKDDGCSKHSDSVAQQDTEDPTFDKCEGGLATSSIQRGGIISSTFMCKGSGGSGFRQWELLRQGNSADSVNPHVTRGMKGCIEWPRGIPKINSKVIPLEERVRKQKSQLQHILKPQANLSYNIYSSPRLK